MKTCRSGKHTYLQGSTQYKGCYECVKSLWHKSALKRRHNISIEQYNEMFTAQNGNCGICKKHQSVFKKALAVDHCHKTNKIRGLLCDRCNRGIGFLKDDVTILESAKIYLNLSRLE